MRITGPKPHQLGLAPKRTADDAAGDVDGARAEGASDSASVVSIRSGRLARSSEVQDAVAARLEVVRGELANGSYVVDFDRLSDSLVADALARGD